MLINGLPEVPLTRAQIDALPYASMQSKIGDGGFSLVILANYREDGLQWISADRVVLVMNHGRLVKTAGLPENLGQTRIKDKDVLENPLHASGKTMERFIDVPELKKYDIRIKSTFQTFAVESIDILERRHTVIRLEEDNYAEGLDWRFMNQYWVDADTGFVWRSIQQTTPKTPFVTYNILKAPA